MSKAVPRWRGEFLNLFDVAIAVKDLTGAVALLEWFTWYEVNKTIGPGGRGTRYRISVTKTRPFMMGHAEHTELRLAIINAVQAAFMQHDEEHPP